MDRSMHLRHLEEAERHVLLGVRNISDQEQRIEDLELHGRDATLARSLLETYLCTQTLFVAHRNEILKALGEA
ncbi:hypothetical protein [Bradyrhizobium sp. BRP23]|uniref:hypothetical protein n=1 Tax=Bradyrhizobium sp. BRP23 TaxID=2793820 RepID=UPI001CD4CD9C|nr:hypothetical protein [Bradyrhizobium sp. BRP23]MCA1419471.1 hypothetical protein [Bradyrhizobium sp. BRP23]